MIMKNKFDLHSMLEWAEDTEKGLIEHRKMLYTKRGNIKRHVTFQRIYNLSGQIDSYRNIKMFVKACITFNEKE